VKIGLEIAARENIKKSDGIVIPDSATQQIACFAHDTITRKIMIDGVFEKHELMAVKKLLIDQKVLKSFQFKIHKMFFHFLVV
jgi:hypothetical protein